MEPISFPAVWFEHCDKTLIVHRPSKKKENISEDVCICIHSYECSTLVSKRTFMTKTWLTS